MAQPIYKPQKIGAGKIPPYAMQRRLRSAGTREFELNDRFANGYRNREDQTNLPPAVLVSGSKNILTNVSERIQTRKGYVLDGSVSTTIAPIIGSITYEDHLGNEKNLRTWINGANTGKVEYRYVDSNGVVTWRTLLSGLSSANFNFTPWWDSTEILRVVLGVNGTANIYEWSGAVAVASTNTATTITKTGTTTWAQAGFYSAKAGRSITINGTAYTYTGGETTTTLTGLSADPTADIAADPVVHQTPITTANSGMTDLDLTRNDLILTFQRQLYVGSLQDQTVYVSKPDNYIDYAVSSLNKVGFGTQIYLDAPPVSMNALENSMVISAGKNQWYQTSSVQSTYTDTSNPAAPIVYQIITYTTNRLKTNANAAAKSQSATSSMKNDVIFISNEPTLDRLGRVEQILGTTQTTNISDPIKLDFDSYDFTDSNVFYNKYFIYVSVPKNGIILIYNVVKGYWEAPQTIPVGKFYTVGGILYGHSYLTPESYKLFEGRADRVDPTTNPLGNAIPCKAVFSYQNYGSPFSSKHFNRFYVEGYISSNTLLTLGIKYDIDGCSTTTSYTIDGSNTGYVCIGTSTGVTDDRSLGKQPLGEYPLGGNLNVINPNALPPKFRIIKTFPKKDFFEVQYSFETTATNSNWEILRFGCALEQSPTIPTEIYD